METSYYQFLSDAGFSPQRKDFWAISGNSEGVQGWKLHLSTIQVDAVELLSKVLPVLRVSGVPFKVAVDETVLGQLNEGELGYSQVGKFMTIYPHTNRDSVELAKVLIEVTKGMKGPVIPSDEKLGDIVYTRYGSYNPIIVRDALGQIISYIHDGYGKLIIDSRDVPFRCPDGITNPFIELASAKPVDDSPGDSKLFGPGYLIVDMVKQNAKGSIFKAIDLRSQDQVSLKIIKQGRKFCLSDKEGRDIRDRLRRQEQLHLLLQDKLNIPKVSDYFEVNGDGYLPFEYIEGESIESFVCNIFKHQPWALIKNRKKRRILWCLLKLAIEIQKLHDAGYIHRDISASNVWITSTDEVYILDLELAYPVDKTESPFGNGTPGFMSPNQQQKLLPEIEDDSFAFGCIMILAVTGLDPRRLIQLSTNKLYDKLNQMTAGLPPNLLKLICSCVTSNPKKRPAMRKIADELFQLVNNAKEPGSYQTKKGKLKIFQPHLSDNNIFDILEKGIHGMLHHTPVTQNTGLWLSPKINNNHTHQNFTELELRKGIHRGVAGVIYTLSRIQKFTEINCNTPELEQKIKWLINENLVIDAGMPGLYFGDAGIAVAINESIQNNLIEPDDEKMSFIKNSLSKETNWYDITHGIAGQGLALLQCFDFGNSFDIHGHLSKKVKYLISVQQPDGSWIVPAGAEGISGETVSGFAHGIAGIIYFLSEYANRFGDQAAKQSCDLGVQWLLRNANTCSERMEWHYSEKNKDIWKWWCHGSPGIALTFLRLYEWTSEENYAEYAKKALNVHPDQFVYSNLSQCHGLSGLGEIYLEAYRVLKEDRWLEKAYLLAHTIYNLRFELSDQSYVWLVENAHLPTSDLMGGISGVLHFYLRLWLKGNEIGFPMLMNPKIQNSIHRNTSACYESKSVRFF